MKLRITIDGKSYDVEVEVLENDDSAPEYPPYPPAPPPFVPAPAPEPAMVPQVTEIPENPKECRSPVTGMVVKVNVEPGQTVEVNQVVIVLESMKMEMQISAAQAGLVKHVLVAPGAAVRVNQVLVEFE